MGRQKPKGEPAARGGGGSCGAASSSSTPVPQHVKDVFESVDTYYSRGNRRKQALARLEAVHAQAPCAASCWALARIAIEEAVQAVLRVSVCS